MAYHVLDVSKYIIDYCNEKEYIMSNLKLQKVLYFLQAAFLVEKGRRCFNEPIVARSFGPTAVEAYNKFKRFGANHINYYPRSGDYSETLIAAEDRKRIREMVDELAKFSSTYLTDITLRQQPWKDAYNRYRDVEITPETLKEYFQEPEKEE